MLVVETIAKIHRAYFAQNKPIKTICREFRVSRRVVRKVIRSKATEFRYERRRQPRLAGKLARLGLVSLCGSVADQGYVMAPLRSAIIFVGGGRVFGFGIIIKGESGELGTIGVEAGHNDRAKVAAEKRSKSHELGHTLRVLHSCHVAPFAASCSTRLGLWILPVGVRGSCAAVRKASRAGTL